MGVKNVMRSSNFAINAHYYREKNRLVNQENDLRFLAEQDVQRMKAGSAISKNGV
jgi:hypothetical protein